MFSDWLLELGQDFILLRVSNLLPTQSNDDLWFIIVFKVISLALLGNTDPPTNVDILPFSATFYTSHFSPNYFAMEYIK